jgi:phosphoribosylanthranilate isomerase
MRIRIKICCINSLQEANSAIEFGANAIGLVANMPSGPGPIPDKLINQIAQSVPPLIGTFLLPAIKIVQVIHVIDSKSVDLAIKLSENVDALLLDSGNPNLKIKELGGTGRVHNWALSRQIRDNSKCPIILAGGLKPENVKQAIEEVQPFGIDVCSGVRTNGKLDKFKLERFFLEALNC